MTNKLVKSLKKVGRKWFLILIIVIIIVAFFNLMAALIITIILIGLFGFSYIPVFIFNKKLSDLLKKNLTLEDKFIARYLKQPLEKVQVRLYQLSKKQEKKSWLIVFQNKQYIYYNEKIIAIFNKYYKKGFGEKEILEKLKRFGVNTRGEVKLIEETLIKYDRLLEREISVKDRRDQQRFS